MSSKSDKVAHQFADALESLREVLQMPKDEFLRDSAIKRFEFTYELAWKAIKAHLEEKGVSVYSPRDAIRAAFQDGLIADDPLWLQMVETRNQSTHAYGEPLAEQVYGKLSAYLPLFEALSKALAKK